MEDALEVVDLLADSGFEGVVAWLLRIVGLVALFAGIGLFLFAEMGVVVPAVLVVVGLVLLVAPSILLQLAELA
jgi:hypothetical protein